MLSGVHRQGPGAPDRQGSVKDDCCPLERTDCAKRADDAQHDHCNVVNEYRAQKRTRGRAALPVACPPARRTQCKQRCARQPRQADRWKTSPVDPNSVLLTVAGATSRVRPATASSAAVRMNKRAALVRRPDSTLLIRVQCSRADRALRSGPTIVAGSRMSQLRKSSSDRAGVG